MKDIMRMMEDLNFVRKWWVKGDLEEGDEMSPKCPKWALSEAVRSSGPKFA